MCIRSLAMVTFMGFLRMLVEGVRGVSGGKVEELVGVCVS